MPGLAAGIALVVAWLSAGGFASAETAASNLLAEVFRFTGATSGQRLLASPADVQRAVDSLAGAGVDAALRARLDTAIGIAFSDIDMLQARYRSSTPSFGFDARSILTEDAVLYQLARGVREASGAPDEATLARLRDELTQVTMDLVDALQRAGSTGVSFHVGQGSNLMALAVLYDWLYGEFTAAQRASIAATMVSHGIVPSFNVMLAPVSHTDRKWYAKPGAVSNWTTICIGAGAYCALALRDNDYDGSFACWNGQGTKVTRTLREHFDAFLPAALTLFRGAFDGIEAMGGTWDEGTGYHHDMVFPLFGIVASLEVARQSPGAVAPGFLTEVASHARQAAGWEILTGIHHAGPSRAEFTYNDGNWPITDQPVCFLIADLARQAGAPLWRAAAWRAKDRPTDAWNGLHLVWHAMFDWSQGMNTERGMAGFDPATIPAAVWFHKSRIEPAAGQSGSNEQVVIWRQGWTDANGAAVMFKGGDKRVDRHDGLDTGTFLYDALGVRWTADLGPPEGYPSYSVPGGVESTFYQTYPKRAMGQNTLVVNASNNDYLAGAVPKAWLDAVNPDQAVDDGLSEHWAPVESLDMAPGSPKWSASVNLATAYARHGIRTKAQGAEDDPRRWFTFDRASGVLEIRDVLEFTRDGNEVDWFMHLPGAGHKPVYQDGSRMLLQVLRDGTTPVYLLLELVRCNADTNGGFRHGKIDENLPTAQPVDLLWGYSNSAHQRSYLRKIALRLTTVGRRIDATVRLSPLPELTGLGESAALREAGLAAGLETVACEWGFNGSLSNVRGGSGLAWAGADPAYAGSCPEGTGALAFNGIDQHATTILAPDPGNSFTVAAWVKTAAGRQDIQTIVANASSGSASGFKFYINNYNTSDGSLVFETANGSAMAKAVTAAGTVPPGTWTHVAAVVDRLAGHVRLFVNGRLATAKSVARTDFRTSGKVDIGCMGAGGAPFWFGGEMDAVQVVPWMMPASEVRSLLVPGLASRWTFHRNTGEITGSGPAWQLEGGAALVNDTRRHGGLSLFLDGSDDAAGIGSPVELGQRFTLSQWVRIASGRSSMQTMVYAGPAGSTTAGSLHLYANTWRTTDRKLILTTSAGGAGVSVASAAGVVPFGQWAHVAATVDRPAGMAKLYVNGVLVGSGGVRPDFATNEPLFLGSMGGGPFTQNLQGHIEDTRIYQRVLTEAEIAALAEARGQAPVLGSLVVSPVSPVVGQAADVTAVCSDGDADDNLRRAFTWGEGNAASDWDDAAVAGVWTYATAGSRVVTARVDDGTHLVSGSTSVTVVPAYAPLWISAPGAWSGAAGQIGPVLVFTVGGGRVVPEQLAVTATCSDSGLIPQSGMILGGGGSERNLTITPVAWSGGTAELTLTVGDGVEIATARVVVTVVNPGTGGKWVATAPMAGTGWSVPGMWEGGHPPWPGAASELDFLSGMTMQAGTLATLQDLASPFETSRLILGGSGPAVGAASLAIGGGGIRLVADGANQPRLDLDANAGGGFQCVIASALELGAPVLAGGNGSAGFVISGAITGNGSLTKTGSSALVLSGPNSYSGRTEVRGGVLSIDVEERLGAVLAVATPDQLWMSGGVLRATAGMTIDDPGRGILLTRAGGGQGFEAVPGVVLTLACPLGGSGALGVTGPGTVVLAGGVAAAHTGGTVLSAGTLRLAPGMDDRLPVTTTVAFDGSASLDMGGNRQRVAGVVVASGASNTVVTAALGNGELAVEGSGNFELGPVTSNTGPLTNAGVVLDASSLGRFSIRQSGNVTVQPKSYNQQSGSARLVLGDMNTLVADKLGVGGMAGGGQHGGVLELGASNTVRVDEWSIGRSARSTGTVVFRTGLAGTPGLTVRSEDGAGRVANLYLSEQWGGSGSSVGTLDLTGGTVDAMFGNVEIGRVTANSLVASGLFVVGPAGGIVDATNLALGVASGSGNGTANGTFLQLGGTVRADTVVLGVNTGTGAAPLLRPVYQLGGGAGAGVPVLAARLLVAGSGARHANSVRSLDWRHGTITHPAAGGDLEIRGMDATSSGVLNLVLDPAGEHVFHAAAGRAIRVLSTAVLSGTGGTLRKTGEGSLVLSGSQAHTGMTTVAGGTLAGSPVLAGPLTVEAGATLAPGESIGTLIAGSTVIGGTLEIEWDVARSPAIDELHVNGDLDIRQAALVLRVTGAPATGPVIFASCRTLSGLAFREVTGLPAGYRVDYGYDTGDGSRHLALVPDPFSAWIGGFGTAVAGQSGEADDPDGDGLANLTEWALAGDPVTAGSAGGSVAVEEGRLVLRFARRRSSWGEVAVIPEWSESLAGPWREDSVEIALVTDGEIQQWRASVAAAGASRYLRLRIARVP